MITSIELVNWKTHGKSTINFSKGTNILIGEMGSGKSSVMDAISFALFGTFPAIKQRRVNTKGLIRNKPLQMDKASVRLTFVVGKDTYAIERSLGLNDAAKATIEKNGEYLQSQPQRVNEEIEKALKLDYDLFSRAVYSEQNRMDYFLDLSSSDRKKQIDGLLGLDKFALAGENSTSLSNRIKEMVAETEKTASGFEVGKAKSELDSLRDEHEKLSAEREDLRERLESRSMAKREGEEKLNEMKKAYSKKILLSKEIAEIHSKLSTLDSEIKKIESRLGAAPENLEGKISEFNSRIKLIKEKEKDLVLKERKAQENLSRAESELSRLRKDMEERSRLAEMLKEKDAAAIDASITEKARQMEELEKNLASQRSSREEGEKWATELEKHMGKCPVCERELSSEMRSKLLSEKKLIIENAKKDILATKASIAKLKDEIQASTAESNRLKVIAERMKGYSEIEPKMSSSSELSESSKIVLAAIRADLDGARADLQSLLEDLSKLNSMAEALERKKGYLSEKEKMAPLLESRNKELSSITVDEEALETAQSRYTELNSEISRITTSIEANEKYAREKERQIASKKEEIERVERLYSEIKERKRIIENLAKFRTSIQETQTILRTRLIDSINEVIQEIWPELYPYGDYTGIMLAATPEDYKLKVKTMLNNEYAWEDVEAIASGGERSIACLSLRIAFALVLVPNLKWLILDEPTHNIDTKGLSKIVKVFNETLPRIIDQVFIITHDEMLKQVSNAKIYMLDRNKEENQETIVQEA
jgi:exonuclease SbcC